MSDDRIKTLNEIMSIPIPVGGCIPPGTVVLLPEGNVDIRCNGGVDIGAVLGWGDTHQRDAARIAAREAENAQLRILYSTAEALAASLAGTCDELQDSIAAKDVRIADLESENAVMRQALDFIRTSLSPAASSFVYADATDLPEPPRRPDGTLAPAPKPLRLPGGAYSRRRIVGP